MEKKNKQSNLYFGCFLCTFDKSSGAQKGLCKENVENFVRVNHLNYSMSGVLYTFNKKFGICNFREI